MAPEFHDRREAGRRLAAALAHLRPSRPLILALPRGGVPVAFEVARALDAELDLLMVRKLGAPGYPEVGIGAVVDGAAGRLVFNDAVIEQVGPSPAYVRAEVHRQLEEIERRRLAYLGDADPIPITGRTVVIVDDGIATGGTVRAAMEGVRAAQPARRILAVPLAPAEVIDMLKGGCDEIVCLATPEPFYAVGAHYEIFDQTSDAEVVALLREARKSPQDR
jgi:putative phosphoribosyl transferase